MTVMARFRAQNWTLNSNDSSPHSSLPLISLRGALARAFGYSSVLDLGPFYFKLRVDALFSCSQALNRADFEAEQPNPRELRAANFECIPELQINPANFASTPLKLLPGFESSCRLPIPSRRELRTSNFDRISTSPTAPSFEFSPRKLQIKRDSTEITKI